MKERPEPRLDKTHFSVTSLHDAGNDKEYWLSKTPAERIEAIEIMRQIVYGYNPLTTRLQRVLEIAQRTPD